MMIIIIIIIIIVIKMIIIIIIIISLRHKQQNIFMLTSGSLQFQTLIQTIIRINNIKYKN